MCKPKREERQQREDAAKEKARSEQRAVVYIDDDGCEITVTPQGGVLYNAADWF